LAALLKQELGVSPELVEGEDGAFDVTVDGTMVFSKKKHGGLIGMPEIVELVKAACPPHSD
jgi:predicted Rdx family selenoprotein